MYLTPTKLMNLQIDLKSIDADSKALKDLINEDYELKQPMRDGDNYFIGNHTEILSKDFTEFYSSPGMVDSDPDASDNHVIHAFHRKMVNQKIEITLSKGVKISVDNEDLENQIWKTLGTNFDVLLIKWAKGASNHGVEWVMPYLDISGLLKFKVINAREVIPIYDDLDPDRLLQVIRYYYKIITIDGQQKKQLIVEVWNDKNYEIYEESRDGDLKLIETKAHFKFNRTLDGNEIVIENLSWGQVPFIRLLNNDEETTDLEPIKSLVDDYDLHVSDASNTLIDVADAVWSLVNYHGQDLAEFRKNLKQLKVIPVDKDGSADPHTLDLPNQARDSQLTRDKDNIYSLGQGVDTGTTRFGDSPSGIALQLMYADVIMKSNSMLRYLESSLYDMMGFINKYYELRNSKGDGFTIFNPQDLRFTFELALPINQKEVTEMLNMDSLLDTETKLSQHPLNLGQTPKEIMDKKSKEIEAQTESFNVNK